MYTYVVTSVYMSISERFWLKKMRKIPNPPLKFSFVALGELQETTKLM